MRKFTLVTSMLLLAIISIGAGPLDESNMPRGTATYSSSSGMSLIGSPSVMASQSRSWSCTIYTSDPWLQLPYVRGDGWQNCIGDFSLSGMDIVVQKKLIGPFWRTLARNSARGNPSYSTQRVRVLCEIDVNTYRIVVDGWVISNGLRHKQSVQSGNHRRFDC